LDQVIEDIDKPTKAIKPTISKRYSNKRSGAYQRCASFVLDTPARKMTFDYFKAD